MVPVGAAISRPWWNSGAPPKGFERQPNGDVIVPVTGHEKLPGPPEFSVPPAMPAARRSASMARSRSDDQAFERSLLGGREALDLRYLRRNAVPPHRGQLDEISALVGERIELTARFLLCFFFLLQLQPRALQVGFNRGDASFGRAPGAHGSLVGGNEQTQILPSLHELAEGSRGDERVDVGEVAVFVDVDEPSLEQLVVEAQRSPRRVELDGIPIDAALGRRALGAE